MLKLDTREIFTQVTMIPTESLIYYNQDLLYSFEILSNADGEIDLYLAYWLNTDKSYSDYLVVEITRDNYNKLKENKLTMRDALLNGKHKSRKYIVRESWENKKTRMTVFEVLNEKILRNSLPNPESYLNY